MNERKESRIRLISDVDSFTEPELLPVQKHILNVTNEMLKFKPSEYANFSRFRVKDVSPQELLSLFRNSSIRDLILPEGASLSDEKALEYHHDLGLFAYDKDIVGISILAREWEHDKSRVDPEGPDRSPFDVITFPGEKDWTRQIDINLSYGDENWPIYQIISIQTASYYAGKLPDYYRDVSAAAYAEMGYEGHNQAHREFKNENEVMFFMSIAEELYDKWKLENPENLAS